MPERLLIIAPHADDETLGMGGTIARRAREGHEVIVAIPTGHGDDEPHPLWPRESWRVIRGEAAEAHRILGVKETIYREIPAAAVTDQPTHVINRIIDELITGVCPDILYVPFPLDLHKDHRELFHACSVVWRPHRDIGRYIREIYAYEVLSETHLNIPYVEQGFLPNTWVDISDTLSTKLQAVECFKSQIRPAPDLRSLETVDALARFRGAQMGAAAAEAFVLVRALN